MDLNQTNEPRFTDEEMAEVDRLQSDPTSEYYYNDPDESFMERLKRKLAPYGEDFKGFIEYLFTPSRHFGTGQYNEGGVAEQMEMFGYTAEGAQQEADKFVGEAGNLEEDISKAASFIVPFYDSGVNIANVAQEYMKPEQERDYEYIKDQFREAGQSAAIEGGLLLMGGVAGKYGAKGIKALADKVKQYEIDPNAVSAFGVGAIRKKSNDAEKALAMIESQDLRDAWVKNKRKELGISDADKNYSARDLVSKQEIKRRQTRKFKEQVEALESGEMSGPEYRRYIRKNQPATKFTKEDVQTMLTSYEDMVGGLDAQGQNKAAKGIIGLTDNLEKGAEVAARLDIPAYNKRDIWVAQITGAGKNMYGRTAVLKNVKFFITFQ